MSGMAKPDSLFITPNATENRNNTNFFFKAKYNPDETANISTNV